MTFDSKEETTATRTRNVKGQGPGSAWWHPLLQLGACFGIAAVIVLAVIFLF